MAKIKIVLRGEDGMTEHASGIVGDEFADVGLVERNRHIYVMRSFQTEHKLFVVFFDECKPPVVITEF